MKSTPRPELPDYMLRAYANDSSVQRAIEERVEALKHRATDATAALPSLSHYTKRKRQFITEMASAALYGKFDLNMLIDAMEETRLAIAMPEITDLPFDLYSTLMQPEIIETFAEMQPKKGVSGPKANTIGSEAVMVRMVFGNGTGSHVKGAYETLRLTTPLHRVFSEFEKAVALHAGRPVRPFSMVTYGNVTGHIRNISHRAEFDDGFARLLMRANIRMLQELIELYPDAGICQCALTDGSKWPAWAEQRPGGEEGIENAGYRVYSREYTNSRGTTVQVIDDEWVGYRVLVLVDLKTGRPIVWTLRDNSEDEPRALIRLMELLYQLWPDCPLKTVVGDNAWDESQWVKHLKVNYGVEGVFRRTLDRLKQEKLLRYTEHATIAGYRHDGVPICREHAVEMHFTQLVPPKRTGLAPGEPACEGDVRARFRCPVDGKLHSIRPASAHTPHWATFPYYPHNGLGQPKRFAHRLALYRRRNLVEAAFARFKVLTKLANTGQARTRLTDFDTLQTLTSLAFTLDTGLMLASERMKRGLIPRTPPPCLSAAAPSPAATGSATTSEDDRTEAVAA